MCLYSFKDAWSQGIFLSNFHQAHSADEMADFWQKMQIFIWRYAPIK
jgi:hypothetical protein